MHRLKFALYTLTIVLTSLWVCLLIWVQQPFGAAVSYTLILLWLVGAAVCIWSMKTQHNQRKYINWGYILAFLVAVVLFFNLTPRNDRVWRSENRELMNFHFVDGQVEINNVRNFIWKDDEHYVVQWDTRRYRLEDLHSLDLIISHFMEGPIAHVFISFGFKNDEYLSLSLEVREEQDEGFSTIGGFFRQYELALVVGDENDLVYSRTNIRDEQVYIYPIKMQQTELQMLFLEYLNQANRLNNKPRWYNTLVSNCTTILFDFLEYVIGDIPRDYRVILPGLLPEYLYDYGQLSSELTVEQWRERAFVNAKTAHLTVPPAENNAFSKLIRQPTTQD